MFNKETMHSLTSGIMGAHEFRAAALGSLRQGVAAQRQRAVVQLHGLGQAHRAMARRLQSELAKNRSVLSQFEKQRKSRIKALVKEMAQDHAGARAEWQGLGRTLRAKRNGAEGTKAGAAPGAAAPGAEGKSRARGKTTGSGRHE